MTALMITGVTAIMIIALFFPRVDSACFNGYHLGRRLVVGFVWDFSFYWIPC